MFLFVEAHAFCLLSVFRCFASGNSVIGTKGAKKEIWRCHEFVSHSLHMGETLYILCIPVGDMKSCK